MTDLIPPHGGVSEPIDRQVPVAEQVDFRKHVAGLAKVALSDADLSALYRMGDGGLSPLTGPMDRPAFNRVLDEEIITHHGGAFAWTIPLSFPLDRSQATSLKVGQTVALVNAKQEIV